MRRNGIGNLFVCLLFFFSGMHGFPCSVSYAAEAPQRIISLAPNMTEILFALGLGDRIAGVTSFCDYPAEAKKKPKVGGMSNPSLEAVISLKPDMVVMTIDGNPKEFAERLGAMNIPTYVFRSKRIAELPKGIRDLGVALGVREKSERLAEDFSNRMNKLREGKTLPLHGRRTAPGNKLLFVIWPEPLIVAGPGSIADDAVTLLGGKNIAAQAQTAYPKYSVEEILRRGPDLIVIGKGHKRMQEVSQGFLNRLKSVSAVKNHRVFYVGDYLYRLGPRTIQGLEELSACLGDKR